MINLVLFLSELCREVRHNKLQWQSYYSNFRAANKRDEWPIQQNTMLLIGQLEKIAPIGAVINIMALSSFGG